MRALETSIQKAQEAHADLVRVFAKRGLFEPFMLPDVSTKEKAQTYVGLDVPKAAEEKSVFLKETVRAWDEQAKPRKRSIDRPSTPSELSSTVEVPCRPCLLNEAMFEGTGRALVANDPRQAFD